MLSNHIKNLAISLIFRQMFKLNISLLEFIKNSKNPPLKNRSKKNFFGIFKKTSLNFEIVNPCCTLSLVRNIIFIKFWLIPLINDTSHEVNPVNSITNLNVIKIYDHIKFSGRCNQETNIKGTGSCN